MIKALALLAGGAGLHLGYSIVPAEHQALTWNALGAAARLLLVMAVAFPVTTPFMVAVVAWIAAEEAQVFVCNAAYIFVPWPIASGQEMCSTLIGTDLGKYSAVAVIAALSTYKG